MKYPNTGSGNADQEVRLADKLDRSPGSFFRARARHLVLAADYADSRLPDESYNATRTKHYHQVCGSTYVALLSTFELAWKTLYIRIVDTTRMYDSQLSKQKKLDLSPELVLANRDVASAGAVFASRWLTWQSPEAINDRFRAVLDSLDVLSNQDYSDLEQMWQIRHILAHSSGVTSPLDEHRLRGNVLANRALAIDGDYLRYTEKRLNEVAVAAFGRVNARLMTDFFARGPGWPSEGSEFAALYLLGQIYGSTTSLPDIDESRFNTTAALYP